MRTASGAAASTETCSIAETTTAPRALRSAWLLASVPPLVKTTWSGAAPTIAATAARAPSSARRASRPKRWTEEGLPVCSRTARMASATAGLTGAVAL